MKLRFSICSLLLSLSVTASGCGSRGIDLTVHNNGRGAVNNVEVDYPGAAFGIARLAPGDSYGYRIKPLGTGEITLSFAQSDGKMFKQKAAAVHAGEAGQMTVVLDQDANQQWHLRAERK